MHYNSYRIILIILLSVLFSYNYADSPPIHIPGTTVTMTPPEGFTLSDSFSGFENTSTSSSILVVELPSTDNTELISTFSDLDAATEALATRGVAVTGLDFISINQQKSPVLSGGQIAYGMQARKYITVIDNDPFVMVTYNIFSPEGILSKEEIFSSIQSIAVGPAKTLEEKLKLLPFTFTVIEPFKIAETMAGTGALLTTFEDTDSSGKLPLIVISASLSRIEILDEKAAARQLSLNIVGFESGKITSIEPTIFVGHSGYKIEIVANNELAIHYISFLDNNLYMRLIATGSRERINAVEDKIEEIAASVTYVE